MSSDIKTLHEAILENIKDTLKASGKFTKVDEGEDTGNYRNPVDLAQVVPGETNFSVKSATSMRHDLEIYVLFLTTDQEKTVSEMRELGYEMVTLLFEDYTRGGTCWRCFPTNFTPGYVAYGNELVVGVQTTWNAVVFQSIPSPS